MLSIALKFVVIAVLFAGATNAATSAGQCGAHGMTLKAGNGLSPCEIASLLVGKGYMPTDSPFPELSDIGENRYPIPTISEADDLRCNPVFYNLVAGCAACQSSTMTWSTWDSWTAHCRENSGLRYIASVMPYDTPLPNWAFTDPMATGGTFNATYARAAAEDSNIPDAVFNAKSASASSGESSNMVNTGAIAGGTIGGFVVGAALGAIAMFFAKKKVVKKNDDIHSVHSEESDHTIAREKRAHYSA